ncbi:hypothetical protein [Paenibacillus ginsengarvi]|uniref:Glycosyl hydrolase family 32 N-terminal domain-containing protein n=1 Tax=Paenibacillus ginsengarvi TaxID=400777 RepID=A0A3B0CEA7_9BACL|nr:hypothetical protein [Paenibacillus ginsengarvi]RKN83750.1 hypothetical protein D7M11_16260 [Paenibacillus ginsengarvi]
MSDSVAIGSRVELFVDKTLIERMNGVSLQINRPVPKEVALTFPEAWEGKHCSYFTVIQDERKVRLYYRGNSAADDSHDQVTCYAESEDGIHFVKPELGLVEFGGSTRNNIVLKGVLAHNFAPFYDPSELGGATGRYKAVAGIGTSAQTIGNQSPLYALRSDDGIRWTKLREEPVMTDGAFDSQNIAFWDESTRQYRCYNRYFTADLVRGVQSAVSRDFVNWEPQRRNEYADGVPLEHFYTNATIVCPGAEHLYLSFPMRFVPGRKKMPWHRETGVSDAVFMTSRDGYTWDRTFMEGWVRPGLEERNWTDRNMMTAYGCALNDTEFSFTSGSITASTRSACAVMPCASMDSPPFMRITPAGSCKRSRCCSPAIALSSTTRLRLSA